MNARQLQYAIELSEVRSFSQLAEKLNITQPALSKQILSLENELGVKLFERSTPVMLTAAGESFLPQARELLFRQEQLSHSMAQFQSGEAGRLVIGISPFRTLYMIPQVVKKVREKFPGVEVVLHEAGSDILRKEIAEGKYDLAIVNLPVEESVLNVTSLEQDVLALAVPENMISLLPEEDRERGEIEWTDCAGLPFIVVGKNQEMRVLFERLCAQAGVQPTIAMEVVGLTTAWAMAQAGIGATILPLQFLSRDAFHQGISLFRLKEDKVARQPVIVTHRGKCLSDYARYAIELLTQKN